MFDAVVEPLDRRAKVVRRVSVAAPHFAAQGVDAVVEALDRGHERGFRPAVAGGRGFARLAREMFKPFGDVVEALFDGVGGGADRAARGGLAVDGGVADRGFESFAHRLA
jgi:hypothetical protein